MSGEASEYFEYDEDSESDESDEGLESDEADSFENDEGDENDESFETDESDEHDEALHLVEGYESDESDENDESEDSTDPRLSYAARIQARNQARQAAWRRNVTSMQAADARAARANQRAISQRVQNAARTRTQTLRPLRGADVITLQLPGRPPLRAMMRPVPASAVEVNKLRQVLATNDARQSRALSRMGSAQAAGFKRITDRQLKNERDLARKIVEGDNSLNKLITKESTERKQAIEKQKKAVLSAVKRAEMRQVWNVALVGSAAPLWTLYADRSKLTAERNVKFLASNVGWLYADEIFGSVMGRGQRNVTSNLGWLSVVGNIATMLYLAKDEQHQRFVSVTRTFDTDGTLTLSAADLGIAKEYQSEFEGFSEVRAVATYVDSKESTTAISVSWANKTLTVTGASGAKVVVVVDTWKDNGDL